MDQQIAETISAEEEANVAMETDADNFLFPQPNAASGPTSGMTGPTSGLARPISGRQPNPFDAWEREAYSAIPDLLLLDSILPEPLLPQDKEGDEQEVC